MNARLSVISLALGLAAALPSVGSSDIYRCSEKGGRVTYQEIPCGDSAIGERANVQTDYPAPNTEARDRLFAREDALYKRLEAQRDRDMQEAVLRDAAAERSLERERLAALEAAMQQQQVYGFAIPWRAPRTGRLPVKRVSALR